MKLIGEQSGKEFKLCLIFSFLGRAFEMAAEKTKARSRHDHCEPAGNE